VHLGARIGVIRSGLLCVGCLTCGAVNRREALTHKCSSIQKHVTQPNKAWCDDHVVADLIYLEQSNAVELSSGR
jgi:coenzyme F420-reducing hydrogenase gamma subunit